MLLFTYGTMRKGRYNYFMIRNAVRSEEIGVTTPGRLWFHPARYPVAKFGYFGDDHPIIGDLFDVDTSGEAFHRTFQMETSAGYNLRSVLMSDGTQAYAFHYDWPTTDPESFKDIPSGDWGAAYDEWEAE